MGGGHRTGIFKLEGTSETYERKRENKLLRSYPSEARKASCYQGAQGLRELDALSDIKKQAVRWHMSTSNLPTHRRLCFF